MMLSTPATVVLHGRGVQYEAAQRVAGVAGTGAGGGETGGRPCRAAHPARGSCARAHASPRPARAPVVALAPEHGAEDEGDEQGDEGAGEVVFGGPVVAAGCGYVGGWARGWGRGVGVASRSRGATAQGGRSLRPAEMLASAAGAPPQLPGPHMVKLRRRQAPSCALKPGAASSSSCGRAGGRVDGQVAERRPVVHLLPRRASSGSALLPTAWHASSAHADASAP